MAARKSRKKKPCKEKIRAEKYKRTSFWTRKKDDIIADIIGQIVKDVIYILLAIIIVLLM